MSTFSPASAARRKAMVSRTRLYGSVNGTPFHLDTITSEEVPSPKVKCPGAASARAATLWASSAGPRV